MDSEESRQITEGETAQEWQHVNPKAAEAAKFYDQHYTILFQAPLSTKTRTVIEDPLVDGKRKCRFCGRSEPDCKFRNDAHAIPEFLGNKSIFTRNECDDCNQKLAQSVEDHLAKWFGPIRTVCQMRGKRGVPKYKASDKSANVEMRTTGLHFDLKVSSALKNGMPALEQGGAADLSFRMPTDPYIPVAAAKCFVKIACCLAAPEDLPHLRQTIEWVTAEDHAASPLRMRPVMVLHSFVPGPSPYGEGNVFLMRRRDTARDVPYLVVALASTNYLFVTFVPFCGKDDYSRREFSFTLCHFPVPLPAKTAFGRVQYFALDWSSTKPEVNDREFTMHIESAVPIEATTRPSGGSADGA